MLETIGFILIGVMLTISAMGLWNAYVYWRDWEKDRPSNEEWLRQRKRPND